MTKKGSWLSGTQFLKATVFQTRSCLLAIQGHLSPHLPCWSFMPIYLMTSFVEEFFRLYFGFTCVWHPVEKTSEILTLSCYLYASEGFEHCRYLWVLGSFATRRHQGEDEEAGQVSGSSKVRYAPYPFLLSLEVNSQSGRLFLRWNWSPR